MFREPATRDCAQVERQRTPSPENAASDRRTPMAPTLKTRAASPKRPALETMNDMTSHYEHITSTARAVQPLHGGSDGWPGRHTGDSAAPLIGSSAVMRALRLRIDRMAATDFTVLIEGESGSGKELVARQIHDLSRRRHGPFVAINCGALVETLIEAELFGIEERTATGVRGRRGKFEYADGGTLFLDEVSDLSPSAQAKLLRAIQDLAVERVGGMASRRINTRIVAATNQSLAAQAQRSLFRPDLFYRLSGVELHVPPLRNRRDDILELAEYFLTRHRHTRPLELSPAAADALLAYDWPGNVRELERLMEGVVALGQSDVIDLDDLPARLRREHGEVLLPSLARGDTLRAWGSQYARLVLARFGYNKRQACRALGISYHTLQAYLRYPGFDASGSGMDTPPAIPSTSRDPFGALDPDDERCRTLDRLGTPESVLRIPMVHEQ